MQEGLVWRRPEWSFKCCMGLEKICSRIWSKEVILFGFMFRTEVNGIPILYDGWQNVQLTCGFSSPTLFDLDEQY
jgi:hypothetical protein